jgi:hypothetical protein
MVIVLLVLDQWYHQITSIIIILISKIHQQNKKEFDETNVNKTPNYNNLEKKILSILKD